MVKLLSCLAAFVCHVLLAGAGAGEGAREGVDIFKEIFRWRADMEKLRKSYEQLTDEEELEPFDAKSRKIVSLVDLEDFAFDGPKDAEGLPDGSGTLTSEDESGQDEFCLRKTCYRAVRLVHATFSHGVMDGQAWVVFQDGGVVIGVVRQSVFHGVYKEVFPGSRRVVRIGVHANGLPAKGTPAWTMDNIGATATVSREGEREGGEGTEGCLFHLTGGVALCGRVRGGAITAARRCVKFAPVLLEGGLLAPPRCIGFSDDDDDDDDDDGAAPVSFDAGANLAGNITAVAAAQSVWMRLHFVDQRPKSIFVDDSIDKLEDLSGPGRCKGTMKGDATGPLRCRNRLDLLSECPRHTFREWGFIAYPGSGSKWAHELLTFATGVRNFQLWIEHEPLYKVGSTLLVKSHHQSKAMYTKILRSKFRGSENLGWRLNHILRFGGRAILLIRNPYEAVMSYWNHATAGEHTVLPNMVEHLQTEDFRKFAMVEIDQWLEVIQDWTTISPHLAVLHLEELKAPGEERTEQLWRVLRHLGLGTPRFRERAECLGVIEVGHHHRRSGKPDVSGHVFSEEIRERFDFVIDEAHALLRRHGHNGLPLHKYRYYRANDIKI